MTENLTPWTDPELEARVVALVLGEASDFERDQLQQLLAENPDLAAFQKRIEAVHGLLADAFATPEAVAGRRPGWQLPGTRRQPLLEVLSTAASAPPTAKRRIHLLFHPAFWTAAAACLVILGVVCLRRPAGQFAATNVPPSSAAAPLTNPDAPSYRESLVARNKAVALLTSERNGREDELPNSGTKQERPAESLSASNQPASAQFGRALRRSPGAAAPLQTANDITGGTKLNDLTQSGAGTLTPNDGLAVSSAAPAKGGFAMTSAPETGRMGKDDETPALQPLARPSSPARKPDTKDSDDSGKSDSNLLAMQEATDKAFEFNGFMNFKNERKVPAIPETTTADEAFSTFSLQVSDGSFKLAQAALGEGKWPDPGRIRIEEFVNAFDYGDPSPAASEPIACLLEQAAHPFQQSRNLLRISLRTSSAGRSAATPLRLTLLLDTSGSMERSDRRATLQAALAQLSGLLHPSDRITLISLAGQPRLVADQLPGDQSQTLPQIVANTPSEGGTNLEAALQLAAEKAREHYLPHAQNRIVLLTDGSANLGEAKPAQLAQYVETMRRDGIAFDTVGIGADGLSDAILEALTRKGDGRYYLLNRPEDAGANFATQLAGAFRPAARDSKVQVWFNPGRVRRYRLLGSDDQRIPSDDLRNDQVDAAETGVALYQFEPLPDGSGDAGYVSVRFQKAGTQQVIERRWPIPFDPQPMAFEQAPATIRLAASAAFLAAKLGDDPLAPGIDLATLDRAASNDELRTMIRQTQNLSSTR